MVKLIQLSVKQDILDVNVAKAGFTAFYVDGTNGSDLYPGDSWDQPFKTIQHALNTADSWCKIFIKAGTYAENLTITGKIGIHLIGEARSNTIVSGTINPIIIYGSRCIIEELWVKTYGEDAVKMVGAYNVTKACIIERATGVSGAGVVAGGNYSVIDDIIITSSVPGGTSRGIETTAEYCEFKNCHISSANLTQGIYTVGSDYCKIHDNTIENTATGIVLGASSDHNTIYHNNLISNTTQASDAGSTNGWFENYFDDHTTDANHDGMADTEYSFTTGKDYQPVSRRNGWEQESLPVIVSSAGVAGTGITQVKTVSVTAAANAGFDTTLGTVTTQGCIIQGVVIHADTAQTANLTSCPVHGGAAKVLEFISAANATQANLDATNKQVGWDGEVYLPTGSTIVMVHNGKGPAPLDLTVTIRYIAVASGGYLA